jgi:hypothetical protein
MKIIPIIILFLVGGILVYTFSKSKREKIVPKITCPPGTAGINCQYSDIDNCNGRGKVIVDSKGNPLCKCLENYGGNNCEICKDGYGGNNCEYSDIEICKGRGNVKINNENKIKPKSSLCRPIQNSYRHEKSSKASRMSTLNMDTTLTYQ